LFTNESEAVIEASPVELSAIGIKVDKREKAAVDGGLFGAHWAKRLES
jgi:hypothetical protein